MNTPDIEGLPEVAALLSQAVPAGEIHHPGHADGAVEHEAAGGGAGAPELGLQQVVDQDNRLMQVVDEVANAVAPGGRDQPNVGFGDRLQQKPVDTLVERESLAIERLQRIVGRLERAKGRRITRHRRAASQDKQHSAYSNEPVLPHAGSMPCDEGGEAPSSAGRTKSVQISV